MIRFIDVYKEYDNGTKALKGINLRIDDGEFVFLVGPSGSGKSTIIKLITGEIGLTEGKLMVNGYSLNNISPRQVPLMRRTLGIIFQDFRLIDKKTVYENLSFAMRAIGASPRDVKRRIPYVLQLVGLEHKADRYPGQLSGGEQQRVAIARALVNNPNMIIADEPTGNLDPHRSLEIMMLLERINDLGTTVLVVTHEKSLVNRFTKRVVAIEDGRIIFMSFAAVCMIVACLLIMGSFSLVAVNLNHMLGDLEDDNLFLAYVDESYTEEEARALQSQIEAVPNVGQVAFVTRAEALDDFRAGREDNPLLADLPDEVLRDRFEIHVDDIEQLQTTSEQVDEITGIADAGIRHGAEHRRRRGHCAGDHAGRGVPVHHRQHHQAGLLLPPGGDRHYEDVRRHQRLYPVALRGGGHDFGHDRRPGGLLCPVGHL